MKPTNRVRRAWDLLSGTRLTVACLALLLVLSAAGAGARAWLAAGVPAGWEGVAEWLRLSGLTDGAGSPEFIFALALLALNLVCGALRGLPEAWAALRGPNPVPPETGGVLKSELETRLGKDAFAELARGWGRARLGRTLAAMPCGEGLVLAARRGRFSALLRLLAHLCLGATLFGAYLCRTTGFQARAWVEEGGRARAWELIRGRAPADWKELAASAPGRRAGGQPAFDPGFEIEWTGAEKGALRIYRGGQLAGTVQVRPGRPARLGDLAVHVAGTAPGSGQAVWLAVIARGAGAEKTRRFDGLVAGQSIEGEDFRFRVLQIQPETELNGPAVELEYQEGERPPERFWVFRDFPDYDFAHRKASARHFTLEGARTRMATELRVGTEPGAPWFWGSLALMAALFWLSLWLPEECYWLRWSAGPQDAHRVELLGASPRGLGFESRFYRLASGLEQGIQNAQQEAQHGHA
jgi:cytochrome c biogenesis protein ResB